MPDVIDTNRNLTPAIIQRLKAEGVKTVIGYLTTNTSGEKIIQPQEARDLAAAGLKLGLVFEVWGGVNNFSHGDINRNTGAIHAAFANRWAPLLGAPMGAVIWFAIDTDATTGQINNLVVPYFESVRAALDRKYIVGVYGSGAVCKAVLDHGSASVAWLSNAMGWLGSRDFKAGNQWTLLQGLPKIVGGIDTDPNTINGSHPDIGDFVPWGGSQSTPIEHDLRWLQAKLGQTPDGKFGPETLKAMVAFVEEHTT